MHSPFDIDYSNILIISQKHKNAIPLYWNYVLRRRRKHSYADLMQLHTVLRTSYVAVCSAVAVNYPKNSFLIFGDPIKRFPESFCLCPSNLFFAPQKYNHPCETFVLFNIKFRRFVQLMRNRHSVFLALLDTFRQKIFYLSVDRTEIVFCPCGNSIIQLCRQPERNLFFLCHISKSNQS